MMLSRSVCTIMAMACLLSASPLSYAEGQLGGLRSAVRDHDHNDHDDDHGHHDHHDDYGHHHHGHSGWLTAYALTSPWWLPHLMMGDNLSMQGRFACYPYEIPEGYLLCDPWRQNDARPWAGRFRAEYGTTFNDLSHIGGHLLLDTAPRFGIDTEFFYREENLVGGGHDDMWTGDFNLVYRFAQTERAAMRSGVGVNWLSDSIGTDFGFNFTYGIDLFPVKPWVVSSTLDWGGLGEASLFHIRTTVGVNIRNAEIYIGHDYFKVDEFSTNSLISGVQIWF